MQSHEMNIIMETMNNLNRQEEKVYQRELERIILKLITMIDSILDQDKVSQNDIEEVSTLINLVEKLK